MLYDCRERSQNRLVTGFLTHGQPYRPHGAKGKGANKPVNGRRELTGHGLVVSELYRGQPRSQNSNLSVSLQCLNRTRSLVFIISSFFTCVWFSVCTQRSISLLIKRKTTAIEALFSCYIYWCDTCVWVSFWTQINIAYVYNNSQRGSLFMLCLSVWHPRLIFILNTRAWYCLGAKPSNAYLCDTTCVWFSPQLEPWARHRSGGGGLRDGAWLSPDGEDEVRPAVRCGSHCRNLGKLKHSPAADGVGALTDTCGLPATDDETLTDTCQVRSKHAKG